MRAFLTRERRRNHHLGLFFLAAIAALSLAACATFSLTPQAVKEHLTVIVPLGPGKFPVVIFFQGTGGRNRRAMEWSEWFDKKGVASAMVDNAGLRGRNKLWGVDDYVQDAVIAWDLLAAYPRIDRSRFALMGFSRGGRQTLIAGSAFGGKRAVPDFAFAFYPGGGGSHTCYIEHAKSTKVHIFYGGADEAGKGPGGFFQACLDESREMKNVEFHEMPGAHHGYDDVVDTTFRLPVTNTLVHIKPNPAAVKKTKEIILKAIKEGWGL